MDSGITPTPPAAYQARREVLWTASLELNAGEALDLFAERFGQAVRGFHLAERLPNGIAVRWMSGTAELVLQSGAESLRLEVQSPVRGNSLEVSINETRVAAIELTKRWTTAEIDLTPFPAERLWIRFQVRRTISPEGDPRELGALFRRLETWPRAESSAASASTPGATPAGPDIAWVQTDGAWTDLPTAPPGWFAGPRGPRPHIAILAVKFLQPRDPTSAEFFTMARLLEERGLRVLLFAENVEASLHPRMAPREELAAAAQREDALLILHHGTPWDAGLRLFARARARLKLLRYHNVSLSECFVRHPQGVMDATVEGRFQTQEFIAHATHISAPSYWGLGDLAGAGAPVAQLLHLPFIHDLPALERLAPTPSPAVPGAPFTLLLLGRQVPSKGLHHALRVLRHYRERYGPGLRLHIVGRRDPLNAAYFRELDEYVLEHRLADQVLIRQEASRAEVAGLLQSCDAVVSMSESECAPIPIMEAGWFGKPVLGLNRGGKSELAGPGQLLFDSLEPALHAAAWHRLATNSALYEELSRAIRRHVYTNYRPEVVESRFRAILQHMMQGG